MRIKFIWAGLAFIVVVGGVALFCFYIPRASFNTKASVGKEEKVEVNQSNPKQEGRLIAQNSLTLFFIDEISDEKWVAKLIDFPSLKERVLFTSAIYPQYLTWIPTTKEVYYGDGHSVWVKHMSGSSPPVEVGTSDLEYYALWVDKTERNLRIALLIEDDRKQDEYEGYGVPYLARTMELVRGKWSLIEQQETTAEACGTLGIEALKTYNARKFAGVVHTELTRNLTCGYNERLECYSESDRIQEALERDDIAFGTLRLGDGREIVFRAEDDEGAQIHPPMFLCEDNCKNATRLLDDWEPEYGGESMGISLSSDFLLIATNNGQTPQVINITSGQRVYHLAKGDRAALLPSDIAAAFASLEE